MKKHYTDQEKATYFLNRCYDKNLTKQQRDYANRRFDQLNAERNRIEKEEEQKNVNKHLIASGHLKKPKHLDD